MGTEPPRCPICREPSEPFYEDVRPFRACPSCEFIFTNFRAREEKAEAHYQGQWGSLGEEWWRGLAENIIESVEPYRKPRRILDYGAGRGDLTAQFRKMGYDVTALEPMTDGYLKDQRYPNLFDLVVGVEVIEHLPNLWEELEHVRRNTAPRGVIYFKTSIADVLRDPDPTGFFREWKYKDDPTHVNFFSRRSIERLADIGEFERFVAPNGTAFALISKRAGGVDSRALSKFY